MIGALLLVAGCAGIGFYEARECKNRVQQIRILLRITEYLKGEIEFSHTVLPDAFQQISRKVEEPFSTLLGTISREMRKQDGRSLKDLIRRSMEEWKKESDLEQEDVDAFTESVGQLGYLDRSMQIHLLETYQKEQEIKLEILKGELPGKQKLFSSLGILGGVFLVILIY